MRRRRGRRELWDNVMQQGDGEMWGRRERKREEKMKTRRREEEEEKEEGVIKEL